MGPLVTDDFQCDTYRGSMIAVDVLASFTVRYFMLSQQPSFATNRTVDDPGGHKVKARTWPIRLLLVLLAPPLVALLIYVPFYVLANRVNIIVGFTTDEYYYRMAVLVWPSYAGAVAIVLALVGLGIRLRWMGWILICVHGFVAILIYTAYLEDWCNLNMFARTGLDTWPANQQHTKMTGPILSLIAVPIVYVLSMIGTFAVVHRRTGN